MYKGNLILVGISYDRTISGDSNITAVRLKRRNGDTAEVMGHWMIEMYDDGSFSRISAPGRGWEHRPCGYRFFAESATRPHKAISEL